MEYTRHGNNAALSIRVLDDAAMRALGFTDRVPEDWYLCRPVSDDHTTSLDVTAAKDGSDWRIDVLVGWKEGCCLLPNCFVFLSNPML